jgi:hypothetical protein
MAPSALYSLDMAPRALIGNGKAANGLDLRHTDRSARTAGKDKKDQHMLSSKYSCDMTPAELLNGFSQHRAKTVNSAVDDQPYG